VAQCLIAERVLPYRRPMTDDPDAAARPLLRVSSTSHKVTIQAEDRDDVGFEGKAVLTDGDGYTTIDSAQSALTIRVPEGMSIVVGSDSGRVKILGDVGDVAVLTESGRISIDQAASVDARTTSARVNVKNAAGTCRVRTKSGRVEIGACTGADVSTNSGRITLRHVDGPVLAHCVSGRIEVEMDAAHDVEAETVSGRVNVTFPHDVQAWQPTEGHAGSEAPVDCDCAVNARSASGRVNVSSR
jgi:DUF4097 and DUF4098 domain-containing protein YvlB